jgi:hypothetical protein
VEVAAEPGADEVRSRRRCVPTTAARMITAAAATQQAKSIGGVLMGYAPRLAPEKR